MDHDSRVTIDYLRALRRGATIRWASDHVTAERPWATGWIDVRIPDGGPPGMGWVWTILDPADPDGAEPGQLWQFPWPQDLEIHAVFDPAKGWYVNELPMPAGAELPEIVVTGYRHRARQVERAYRQEGGASAQPVPAAIFEQAIRTFGSSYGIRRGWSTRSVSSALSDWADRRAGRGDLRFEWDREAGDSQSLELAKRRAAAGGPSWDLGDGVQVVDGLMDELVELLATDPDEAVRVTRALRETVAPLLENAPRSG